MNVHKSRAIMRFLRGPNADKFDLHDYFDVVKINKNRKCASCSGGEHGFEKQLFDANSYQVPPSISFLLLARHWLVFFENHKIDRMVVLRRPGGMRGGAGGRFEGGLRSADLRFAISDLCFRFDTPALAIRQGRRIQSLRGFRRA